jgi:hypothetical protein
MDRNKEEKYLKHLAEVFTELGKSVDDCPCGSAEMAGCSSGAYWAAREIAEAILKNQKIKIDEEYKDDLYYEDTV